MTMADNKEGAYPGYKGDSEDMKPAAAFGIQKLVNREPASKNKRTVVQKVLHLRLVFPRGADKAAIDPAAEHLEVLLQMKKFDPEMIVFDLKSKDVNVHLDFPKDEQTYKNTFSWWTDIHRVNGQTKFARTCVSFDIESKYLLEGFQVCRGYGVGPTPERTQSIYLTAPTYGRQNAADWMDERAVPGTTVDRRSQRETRMCSG